MHTIRERARIGPVVRRGWGVMWRREWERGRGRVYPSFRGSVSGRESLQPFFPLCWNHMCGVGLIPYRDGPRASFRAGCHAANSNATDRTSSPCYSCLGCWRSGSACRCLVGRRGGSISREGQGAIWRGCIDRRGIQSSCLGIFVSCFMYIIIHALAKLSQRYRQSTCHLYTALPPIPVPSSALPDLPYMSQELTRNPHHINNLGHLTRTQPSLDPIQKSLPTRIPVPLLGKLLATQRMHAFPERGGGERRVECV